MNNRLENEKITVSIPPKIDTLFRQQALNAKLALSELFIEYQKNYSEKLNEEKQNKRLTRELKEKGKVNCPRCGSEVDKLVEK